MNQMLTEQIARHILTNLGVIPSSSFDSDKSRSLTTQDFLLNQKILFKNEKGDVVKNSVYGCQVFIEQRAFTILVGDCSQEENIPEFCVAVQFTGNPGYGLYMICDPNLDGEALIAVTVDEKNWMPCTTFLQATFLAAMEQLKDLGLSWEKCTNYQKNYEMLLSMVNFHAIYWEAQNAGQEG